MSKRDMEKKAKLAQLLMNLKDADPSKRADAATRLGKRNNQDAVRPLIDALSDPNYQVRRNAARSLGRIGNVWAIEPLVAALGDQTATVRKMAATALGEFRDASAIEALCRALQDKKRTVRDNALQALLNIGSPAVSGLASVLSQGTEPAQQEARVALGVLYGRDRQQTTSRLLSDPKLTPLERFQALDAICKARPGGLTVMFWSWMGNVSQFCNEVVKTHQSAGTTDAAECRGAESVLQFLTLVRAGHRDTRTEQSELLRGSSSSAMPQHSDELLRGSDETALEQKPRSLWKRLFSR